MWKHQKIKRRIISSGILFLLFSNILSQTPDENLEKYWNYKERIYEKFLVSIPYCFDLLCEPFTSNFYKGTGIIANSYNPNLDTSMYEGRLAFGDATCDIGTYLGALATEYKLLQDMNMSVLDTEEEVFRTLMTLIRLDINAEIYYGCEDDYNPIQFAINGFFIRDDVYSDFHEFWYQRGYNAFNPFILFNGIKSDYSPIYSGDYNEMSQDQIWNLFGGLALVRKIVDSETIYTNTYINVPDGMGYRGVTISEIVYQLIDRYIDALQNNNNGYWEILNPCTNSIVDRGGYWWDILRFCYSFRKAAEFINDEEEFHYSMNIWDVMGLASVNWPDQYSFNSHGDILLRSLYPVTDPDVIDVFLAKMVIAAQEYNDIPYYINEQRLFCFDHIPLLNTILHDYTPNSLFFDYYLNYVENLLNIAPENGPSFYGTLEDFEWSTDRLSKPIGKAYHEYFNEGKKYFGDKPGIDYLLLHNLFILEYKKLCTNRIIDQDIPFEFSKVIQDEELASFIVGDATNQLPFIINSLDDIHCSSTIYNGAEVTLKAGGDIFLDNGFEIQLGAEFKTEYNEWKDFFDNAGKKSYFSVPKLKMNYDFFDKTDLNEKITIYPNPAKENINILIHNFDVDNSKSKTTTSIYSLEGLLMLSTEKVNDINIQNLNPGIYIIKVKSNNNVITKEFIKY